MAERPFGIRVFKEYVPTPEDLANAGVIPTAACPRRYCWWWRSLAFDWDVLPAEGCMFLKTKKPETWRHNDVACSRMDGTSNVDHYESREPELTEDGFDIARFFGPSNRR